MEDFGLYALSGDSFVMSTGEPQDSMIVANGHANNGVDTGLKIFKREPQNRIFVNRGIHLDKIKFYGFDMDYTLAVYKSPDYETMGFNLLKERLVQIGYPEAMRHFEYDASFPVRGLWFDKVYGNLLKVDSYGNILVCVHGFQFLKPHEVAELYPNKYIQLDDKRIYVLNTLFNIPETYMLACVIDFFANNKEYTKTKTGITMGSIHISYKSIFQDVRGALDWLHDHGDMKTSTLSNLDKYIQKDEKLAVLLERIRHVGAKCVLITNSGYDYTNKIMEYLLDFPDSFEKRHWTSYWDCVIVNASKPLFFEDGTILRRVDTTTGVLSLGRHLGPIERGDIYSGGSCEVVSRLLGAKGSDVLYIGDHIFGDILKSKKIRGWRTFLIIPELAMELSVWTDKRQLFESLTRIEIALSDIYRHLDSSTNQTPDTSQISHSLRSVVHELDMSYGMLGSLFRSGSRQTFFASQVRRYADIYASSILNLLHYPFCYMFRAPAMLMPHEATVDHHAAIEPEIQPAAVAYRSRSTTDTAFETPVCKRAKATGDLPHAYAETPREMVHIHDDADSEEERSASPFSNSPDNEDKGQVANNIVE